MAGVTKTINMTVNFLPLGEQRYKLTGSTNLKMTSFKVEPPAPKIALGISRPAMTLS